MNHGKEKKIVNSVLNFRRVTHFWLCMLETQVFLTVSMRGNFIPLVLLFASVERFGVSRMQDFFYNLRVVLKQTETLVLFLNFHAL